MFGSKVEQTANVKGGRARWDEADVAIGAVFGSKQKRPIKSKIGRGPANDNADNVMRLVSNPGERP